MWKALEEAQIVLSGDVLFVKLIRKRTALGSPKDLSGKTY
jgi:hypothetical protein